jgi:polysaccharide deacetylase family protein (PEP-CTERM system associated)
MKDKFLNVLTFDIEDWYQSTFLDIAEHEWDSCESTIEDQLYTVLDLLQKTDNKATFFTVALLARKHPEAIKRIIDKGHELALHSYSHTMIPEQSEEEFENDIIKSLDLFSSVSEQKIVGYRAPCWSLTNSNKTFVVDILRKYGFLYDSSIFPFKTFQYGNNNAPLYPNILNTINGNSINEIPPSVMKCLNIRIPFSGGFYFRMLPYALIKSGIRRTNKEGYPAVTYFHLHDVDTEYPRLIKGLKESFIVYANQKRCKEKFYKMLHDFRFGRMDEYVKRLSHNI